MPTFMNKALAYLGLKDLEDDEYYDDDYEDYEEEAAAPTAPPLVGRTVYPRRDAEEQPETRSFPRHGAPAPDTRARRRSSPKSRLLAKACVRPLTVPRTDRGKRCTSSRPSTSPRRKRSATSSSREPGDRQLAAIGSRPRPPDDRLLFRAHLRARWLDGKSRRASVLDHARRTSKSPPRSASVSKSADCSSSSSTSKDSTRRVSCAMRCLSPKEGEASSWVLD